MHRARAAQQPVAQTLAGHRSARIRRFTELIVALRKHTGRLLQCERERYQQTAGDCRASCCEAHGLAGHVCQAMQNWALRHCSPYTTDKRPSRSKSP